MVHEKVEHVMEWVCGLENGFDSVFNYRPLNQVTIAKSHMVQFLAIAAFWYDVSTVTTKFRELSSYAKHNLSPKRWQWRDREENKQQKSHHTAKPQHEILNTIWQEPEIARVLRWVCPAFP